MNEDEKPAGNEPIPREPENKDLRRPRRKPSLKIDKEKCANWIFNTRTTDLDMREERNARRMERRAKLMGWLEQKDWPWENSANFFIPIMLTASLRTKATLENAIKSVRPVIQSKAIQRRNVIKQKGVDDLIDYQVFVENKGETKIDDLVNNFVDDEAVFIFAHWVREQQTMVDIRVLPGLQTETDHIPQLLTAIKQIFPAPDTNATMDSSNKDGWVWQVTYTSDEGENSAALVDFYERDDGKLEAHISQRATTFNGPLFEVLDFEDVSFPVRAANLQPPGPSNPLGASYVDRNCKASVDTIRRNVKNGTYDLLSDQDLEDIEGAKSPVGSGSKDEEPKEQMDQLRGTDTPSYAQNPATDERQIIERYGRWDVNGDDLEEDVIIWMEWSTKKICKIALLTELYPGLPIKRPIISRSFIPIPNRIYGMSLPELLESNQDAQQTMLDQHIDYGTITNVPFGFYRASSGLKPEPMYLSPGEWIPIDNPQTDVYLPQFPQKDSAFALNTMAVLQQFAERIQMFSDVSYGRVPTGKASALRTLGTTVALLGQGDARSEQVLRRLFSGLAEIWDIIHRLDKRFMPAKKQYRVFGVQSPDENAYAEATPDSIDMDAEFEFKATMLNTNKQAVAETLKGNAALLISPLAMQLGIVTPEEVYNLLRDILKASDQDPDLYMKRPSNVSEGQKLTANEAISAILHGQVPEGGSLEPPIEHMQILMEFAQSDNFGLLTPEQSIMFRAYLSHVRHQIMIDQQQQQMMQAAQQFQQVAGGQGGGGGGGVPSTIAPPPPVNETPVNANEQMPGAGTIQ